MALDPNCTQISGFGALVSMNSREATFDELNVVVELNAIPIPIPKIITPPKRAMVAKLNTGDWKIEGLGLFVGLVLADLRLIFALLPSSQEWFFNFSLIQYADP
jgi:hypothetical protein